MIRLEKSDVITLNTFDTKVRYLISINSIELNQMTLNNYNGQLDLLIDDIKDQEKQKDIRTVNIMQVLELEGKD